MKPVVSVITPCYRQAHFLGEAIQSVLAQTYRAVEMVVINDGSDDDTEAVARSFGEQIRYHWQPNSGLPAARNRAIALSTGKYILCLDADDRLAPEAIGWLVEAARGQENALCAMGFKFFEGDDTMGQGRETLPPSGRPLGLDLLARNLGPPHIFLCSRSMLVAVGGFDTGLNASEDWDAWQRLVFAGADVIPVARIGALYRRHSGSMSTNFLLMARTQTEVLRRTLRRIANNPQRISAMGSNPREISRTIRRKLARELFDFGYALRNDGQYLEALRQYCYSMGYGDLNVRALSAILKLVPHRVLCRARVGTPAASVNY